MFIETVISQPVTVQQKVEAEQYSVIDFDGLLYFFDKDSCPTTNDVVTKTDLLRTAILIINKFDKKVVQSRHF